MSSRRAATDPDFDSARAPLGTLRALWPFVARERGLFAAWLLALGASSSATLALPLAFRRMVDAGFREGGQINTVFALLFAIAVALALATAARFYFVSLLGERVVADLRRRLYAHMLQMRSAFHDQNLSGELGSRLTTDAELLRGVVGSAMSVALRSTITVLGSVVMLFVTSPRLAGWTLLGMPVVLAPILLAGRRLRSKSREGQDRIAEANRMATEVLGAIGTVQAHAREPHETQRFARALDSAVDSARRRIRVQAWVTAFAIVSVFGAISLVLWVGAHDVVAGRLSAGALAQFVFYAVIGGGSAGALAETWNELQRAAGGMGRISELLASDEAMPRPLQPAMLPTPVRGQIDLNGVTFHYHGRAERPALHDLDLHIAPGQTVALVGPSGAGKSTVLSMLLRFHDPDSGAIRLDGEDLRNLDLTALRESIALVPQSPVIFAASAAYNIRYGRLDASESQVEAAARAAHADAFIRALPNGYDEPLGERGARLSGGQQQRIAIARALLKNAPVLLLDEATSALDAQSERAVQEALDVLMQGRTTLIVAHRLATVLKADRIVVMDGGRIVAEGSHHTLMAQGGLYAELARLQFLQ